MLDIGTGTGRMAELFAPYASHVSAIDKSNDMLRVARARLQDLPPARLELLQGDFTDLPFADASFDTVLFHQVLHYAQLPETRAGRSGAGHPPRRARRHRRFRRPRRSRNCANATPMRGSAFPTSRWSSC